MSETTIIHILDISDLRLHMYILDIYLVYTQIVDRCTKLDAGMSLYLLRYMSSSEFYLSPSPPPPFSPPTPPPLRNQPLNLIRRSGKILELLFITMNFFSTGELLSLSL
ncbi:hypothetical protein AAMO2058_001713200 [Amorphochlora amoebiformis]